MSDENALFGSIGSGLDPDAGLQPRANKPDTYLLYVDGELINAYGKAFEALKGLRDEPATRSQKIELFDMSGAKLAEKRLVEVLNTTNMLQPSRTVPKLYLTDDMKRDLVAEGRDPAVPFREANPVHELQEKDWFKGLQAMAAQPSQTRTPGIERERHATRARDHAPLQAPDQAATNAAMVAPAYREAVTSAPAAVAPAAASRPIRREAEQEKDWFKELQAMTAQLAQVREGHETSTPTRNRSYDIDLN